MIQRAALGRHQKLIVLLTLLGNTEVLEFLFLPFSCINTK